MRCARDGLPVLPRPGIGVGRMGSESDDDGDEDVDDDDGDEVSSGTSGRTLSFPFHTPPLTCP